MTVILVRFYEIAVFARSTVSMTFNNWRMLRIVVQ